MRNDTGRADTTTATIVTTVTTGIATGTEAIVTATVSDVTAVTGTNVADATTMTAARGTTTTAAAGLGAGAETTEESAAEVEVEEGVMAATVGAEVEGGERVEHLNDARQLPKIVFPSPSAEGKRQAGMSMHPATSSTVLCRPSRQVCFLGRRFCVC